MKRFRDVKCVVIKNGFEFWRNNADILQINNKVTRESLQLLTAPVKFKLRLERKRRKIEVF